MKTVFPLLQRGLTASPLSLGCLMAALAWAWPAPAADPAYINYGAVGSAPQVDALEFINYGTFNITTTDPFETSDTLNFTNFGTLSGSVGFRFDTVAPDFGPRFPAASVVNGNGATIQAFDGPTSYVWATATNIVSRGLLSVGGNGWIKLAGTNVDVSRSGLEVTPLVGSGSFNFGTNFIPDVAISDLYWGTTNFLFDSSTVWDGTNATAPPHVVSTGFFTGIQSFGITPQVADSFTNAQGGVLLTLTNADGSTTNVFLATNLYKQAVFVSVGDPSIMTSSVHYDPSPFGGFATVAARISFLSTNVITQNVDPIDLFFYDTLASDTNRGLAFNIATGTFRPINYSLARVDDGRYANGRVGMGRPGRRFLYDPATYTNAAVSGDYAGYGAFVDHIVSEPPPVPGGTVTNLPGRIQIYADVLDMSATRIRGEGEMIVQTKHLISSTNAAVDCQNLSYNLASTNGLLSVVNLAKQNVQRLSGDLLAWSAVWTNLATIVITNNFVVTNSVDTNGMATTNATPSPVTNTVTENLYALVLDGDSLISLAPVTVWDFDTHSTNVVVNDRMTVAESFFIDGETFTLNGAISLSSASLASGFTTSILDWVFTNAPNLLSFTNNGSLSVPNEAHFGDDRPVPYVDFVNAGTLTAGSVEINSAEFQNRGSLRATVGRLHSMGGAGVMQNGSSTSAGDTSFTCSQLKFGNYRLTASSALNFTVTNSLSDAGFGPRLTNVLTMSDGFNLLVKPAVGDLLGTTFRSQPPNFVEVDSAWAAEDRGVSGGGYADNQAIGILALEPLANDAAHAPLFFFAGTGNQNGLYVDLLDLTALSTNYANMLLIDPSLTIYYAAANLSFTPPPNASGIPQEPEEFLDGQFGGRLRWVSAFAGPNSSVDVIINGVTVRVNRALRFSKIIDSNGNGIPNFYDPNPFNTVPLTVRASIPPTNPAPAVAITWNAAPETDYQVEFATDIAHPDWQTLGQSTNSMPFSSMLTIWDTNAPAGTQRFYRVKMAQ